jgi:phosphoribosylformimino-5-aminoimidazole carboxamide ribotide isomerase
VRIIPAIDLRDGKCVRLVEGRPDSQAVYSANPLELARRFKESGAELIHVVDLDGAFRGAASDNIKVVSAIAREAGVPIEVGGGVRSIDDIRLLIEQVGVSYVIVGTMAVEQPALLGEAIARFGNSMVVGIDARGLDVATRGWTESAGLDALDLANRVVTQGVTRIVYTDISRDGRLEGPNFETTREIALSSRARVTASGGVSSLDDISRLCELEPDGVDSIIVGKALYENRFSLEDAIATAHR